MQSEPTAEARPAPQPISVLDQVLTLADGAVLERRQQGADQVAARLVHGEAAVDLSVDLADVLLGLRGVTPRRVVDGVAATRRLPADDRQVIEAQLEGVLGQLLEAGLLQLAVPGSEATTPAPRWRDPTTVDVDQSRLAEVSAALRGLGYTSAGLHELMGRPEEDDLDLADAELVRRRLAARDSPGESSPLVALLRLFVADDALAERDARAVLPEPLLDALLATGLLQLFDGQVSAAARLVPQAVADADDLLLAFDNGSATGRADLVPGPHPPSRTLARFTPRRRVARALDLGTGVGIQALLLARHADQVVATDVNPRALGYAAINAALNGVTLDLRQGSLLEPLGGETYDLLVSNPPYVLSPETAHVFRDSGYPGDSFNRLVASTFGSVVGVDGIGVLLLSWSQPLDQDEPVPLGWVTDPELDALLVWTGLGLALDEAIAWNQESAHDPAAQKERIDAWLAWYAEHGIERIGYGALVLHRRGREDRTADVVRAAVTGNRSGEAAGDQIARILRTHEQLVGVEVERLLDARLLLVDGVVVRSEARRTDSGWRRSAEVELPGGIGFSVGLTPSEERALDRLGQAGALPAGALAPLSGDSGDEGSEAAGRLARGLLEAGLAELLL